MSTDKDNIPTYGGKLEVQNADPADFPIDLSIYPKVLQSVTKFDDPAKKAWVVQYFGVRCMTEVPTKEDWNQVAEYVKAWPTPIKGVLCMPCYIPMTVYAKEEDSPTIEEYLNGNYVNKGTKGAYAIVYLAMEDK